MKIDSRCILSCFIDVAHFKLPFRVLCNTLLFPYLHPATTRNFPVGGPDSAVIAAVWSASSVCV